MSARMPQILWRRLDRPGHDACWQWSEGDRQGLDGVAVWQDAAGPAQMAYHVSCDGNWLTRAVRVQGRVGARDLTLSIHRDEAGNWRANGEELPDVTGLTDIDLGFTPATNTLPIRRMMARRQAGADLAAVWLDAEDWRLKRLPQSYAQAGQGWRYASPTHDFTADLAVDADGFVTDYPGLWVKEG